MARKKNKMLVRIEHLDNRIAIRKNTIAKVKEDKKLGFTTLQLSKKYNVHIRTIRDYLKG